MSGKIKTLKKQVPDEIKNTPEYKINEQMKKTKYYFRKYEFRYKELAGGKVVARKKTDTYESVITVEPLEVNKCHSVFKMYDLKGNLLKENEFDFTYCGTRTTIGYYS